MAQAIEAGPFVVVGLDEMKMITRICWGEGNMSYVLKGCILSLRYLGWNYCGSKWKNN